MYVRYVCISYITLRSVYLNVYLINICTHARVLNNLLYSSADSRSTTNANLHVTKCLTVGENDAIAVSNRRTSRTKQTKKHFIIKKNYCGVVSTLQVRSGRVLPRPQVVMLRSHIALGRGGFYHYYYL